MGIDPNRKNKGQQMGQKRYTPEQIIGKLRQAEVRSAEGARVAEIVRELGITEQTYYRWRKEYGGLKVAQAKRLKELEKENARLKRAVADLTLDKLILEEAAKGNF
jgi:putative transposase